MSVHIPFLEFCGIYADKGQFYSSWELRSSISVLGLVRLL